MTHSKWKDIKRQRTPAYEELRKQVREEIMKEDWYYTHPRNLDNPLEYSDGAIYFQENK